MINNSSFDSKKIYEKELFCNESLTEKDTKDIINSIGKELQKFLEKHTK